MKVNGILCRGEQYLPGPKHRGESPVIVVQTHLDGADASAPRVTMVPRSEWDQPGGPFSAGDCDTVRSLLAMDGFTDATQYIVITDLHHPVGRCKLNADGCSTCN